MPLVCAWLSCPPPEFQPRLGPRRNRAEERDTFTRLPWPPDEGHREGVQMLATNNPSPFYLNLMLQRESKAEENRKRDAERAELLAHEDQFITISEIGRAIVESGHEGYTGNLWQVIHTTLKGEPEAVIFCHWEGEKRWTPLPDPAVTHAVVGSENSVEPAARFDREPMRGPIGYYIGGCFIATGDGTAFAIRRDLADRLFGLPEPASAPREAIATPTPAPSASAPAVADPVAVATPAEAAPDADRPPTVQQAIAPYVAKLMQERPNYTAEKLHLRMKRDAGGDDSPFSRLTHGMDLFCVEADNTCRLSTVRAALTAYRKTIRKRRSSTVEVPSNP